MNDGGGGEGAEAEFTHHAGTASPHQTGQFFRLTHARLELERGRVLVGGRDEH